MPISETCCTTILSEVEAVTTTQDIIVAAEEGGIATVTLNRPVKRNAVSLAMWRRLGETFSAGSTAARRAEISAIVEGAMNSADYREGARAFPEKRKPTFTSR